MTKPKQIYSQNVIFPPFCVRITVGLARGNQGGGGVEENSTMPKSKCELVNTVLNTIITNYFVFCVIFPGINTAVFIEF